MENRARTTELKNNGRLEWGPHNSKLSDHNFIERIPKIRKSLENRQQLKSKKDEIESTAGYSR